MSNSDSGRRSRNREGSESRRAQIVTEVTERLRELVDDLRSTQRFAEVLSASASGFVVLSATTSERVTRTM